MYFSFFYLDFALGPVCLLESSFLLEKEFWENKFWKSELFSDVW